MKTLPARLLQIALCLALLAACGREPDRAAPTSSEDEAATATAEQATVTAVLKRTMDLAACLAEPSADPDAQASQCPTYVLRSLAYMIGECSAVGGALQPIPEASYWSLDVDADGKSEVLIDLTQNFTCYGEPAVFSCGSLGCPYFLYAQRGEAWMEIGAVNAEDAPGIELLDATAGTPATLRGGCAGERPCSELTHYAWNGKAYERSLIEYRGHLVDVVPGGLWKLTRKARVLTAPSRDGQMIDEYPTDTTMVVMGTARDGPYQYVSPCNGCRRGFVDAAVLKQ